MKVHLSLLALGATLGLVLSSQPAHASKARVSALQGALGLVDTQTIFDQPGYVTKLGSYLTLEGGSTAVNGTPKAEGGFLMGSDGSKWGAYLGHQSANQNLLRSLGTFQQQDNAIDLFYGKDGWGANVSLSNSEDENTSAKQTTVIGRFGLTRAVDEFYGTVELFATAEKAGGAKYRGAPILSAGYLRRIEKVTVQGDLAFGDGTIEVPPAASENMRTIAIAVAANHRPIPELYYGIAANYLSVSAGRKYERFALPVTIGLEKEMLSWLVIRGSILQNVLFGQVKNEFTAASKATRNLNDTRVAVGLGMKATGFLFDFTVAAADTGLVNGNSLLGNASLTYSF